MAEVERRRPVLTLDVGGTHATAGLVDVRRREVIDRTRAERRLRPDGSAAEILTAIVDCATESMGRRDIARTVGIAMPGPFDYPTGIGRFAGVAKFESLAGVNVGTPILKGLAPSVGEIRFLNDADAFAIGEWTAGAAMGHERPVAITIGTGIGSTFLDGGRVVEDGPLVPPTGRAYLIVVDGQPLEERVSRRAILRAAAGHPVLSADPTADVRELAAAARAGDAAARAIFEDAIGTLGRALGPWLARFGATILVVGGSIGGSWDLVEAPLVSGLGRGERPWHGPVRRAALGADAGLIGAAIHADRRAGHPPEAAH